MGVSESESQSILQLYEEIVGISRQIDNCFEMGEGKIFSRRTLIEERKDEYWSLRDNIETKLSDWLILIRRSLEKIPDEFKTYNMEKSVDPYSGNENYYKKYVNDDFASVIKHYNRIVAKVEAHNGILIKIENEQPIYKDVRDIRGILLLYTKMIPLFIPKLIISIDQYINLIFQLAELDLNEIASLIESINNILDRKTKCLNARTALEKYIDNYLENQRIEITAGFYIKLKTAIDNGLTEVAMYKSIARHYTYISKIVHEELEANVRNTEYAINGILIILLKLLPTS